MIRTRSEPAGDNTILSWGAELDELDGKIKALQDAKRDFYTAIRDSHGKVTADALKAAQRIRGMDSEKRAKAEEIDAETARLLAVMERPRAPRAMRAHGNIEQFDAETGEIKASVAPSPGTNTPLATRGAEESVIAISPEQPQEGGDHAKSDDSADSVEYPDLIDGRRLDATPAEHQPPQETNTDEAPGESAADEISPTNFQPPAFLTRERKPLRPHCQHPDLCRSGTRDHCRSCLRAIEGAAA